MTTKMCFAKFFNEKIGIEIIGEDYEITNRSEYFIKEHLLDDLLINVQGKTQLTSRGARIMDDLAEDFHKYLNEF